MKKAVMTTLAAAGLALATLVPAKDKTASVPVAAGSQMSPAMAVEVGNTKFAKDLYGKLKSREGNLFFSPHSISTALAMTYGGARGETEKQMAQAMHFMVPQAQLHPAFAELRAGLEAVQAKGKIKLAVANSLWPQQDYAFLPEYLELCKTNYGTAVTPMDFKGATEEARKTINGWVEEKTNNKIQELFKPGTLDPLTRLVLVNAIYFKGDWASQFKKEATQPKPFHLADGTSIEVPTMHQTAQFAYQETEDAQVLEMPYAGDDLVMVIVLPRKNDGLPALEEKLGVCNLAIWVDGLKQQETQVWLPKFKTVSEFSLNQTLIDMGMKDAFSAAAADFSGMDGSRNLFIGTVVHKAFVEVNEEGTEAAAATGLAITTEAMHFEPPPAVFRADHPFLFMICKKSTYEILFLGRIADPTK